MVGFYMTDNAIFLSEALDEMIEAAKIYESYAS